MHAVEGRPRQASAPSAKPGRILYVSRSAPPGKSGSAHVLRELLAVDGGQRLQVAGARPVTSRDVVSTPTLRLFPTEISLFGRGARFFSLPRQMLLPWLGERLAELARAPDIEAIVCVFPDALYCEAALLAAGRTGKPLRYYFHNTYADNRRGIAGWHARRLEARMMASAERLLFISDALMQHYIERHPDIAGRCSVVPHPVAAAGAVPRGFASHPVRATMMGNLNPSNLDAAARMLRALAGHPALRIRLCTPVPRLLLEARGVDLGGVEYLGYLPEAEMAELLADTDLFLLPHGLKGGYSEGEYRTIFPTRAAHYLAHARPVLAHCPDDSGLGRFLIENDCAVCVPEADESRLKEAFERLLEDPTRQLQLARHASAVAARFQPRQVLERLLDAWSAA